MKQKVNILGTEYEIVYLKRCEDDLFENGEADAWCDNTSCKIAVRIMDSKDNMDNQEAYVRRLLRHEIIHAFLFESGLGNDFHHPENGHEETMVDWIARQSPKIFKVFQELDIM